jgi:proteasome lid subunit RPN8/RPN11
MKIGRTTLDGVKRWALHDRPEETCGVLATPGGRSLDEWPFALVLRLHNAADQPEYRFAFDANEQLMLWQFLEDGGYRPVAIFHSHTAAAAEMSQTDLRYAVDASLLHLVYSVGLDEARLWRVEDGHPIEIPLEVVT